MMTKTLLEGVIKGFPMGASAPDADASDPIAALTARTTRTLRRDLAKMSVASELAERIVPLVLKALRRTLEADVSLDDKTAACLVAERVMAATVVAVLGAAQPAPAPND